MTEREDPIIDALLEETLGGKLPPDLTARILAQWSAEQGRVQLPVGVTPVPLAFPVIAKRRRRDSSQWLPVIASLTVTAVLLLVGYFSMNLPAVKKPQVAKNKATPTPNSIAQKPAPNKVLPSQKKPLEINRPEPVVIAKLEPSTKQPSEVQPNVPSLAVQLADDAKIVSFVNLQLTEALTKASVTPAPRASDAELCRRLFVRVIGRIPSVDELQAYEKDAAVDKYAALVNSLLTDERYVEEYAKHWSTVWANVLIGRGVGLDRDEIASRAGLEKYLRDSFAANKSYDQLVIELLSASGAGQLGADNFNGATNYLLAHADDTNVTATASVCRVFLGMQLQCAQCHNHPTESFTQQQFWSLNAYLRQMKVRHADRNDPAQLLDFDYLGENGRDPLGYVNYELPNGVLKAAPPMFLNGHEPAVQSGYVHESNRREALAREVVGSEQFALALVNRIWSQFHGYGFTRPIDGMGPANQPSHPELLTGLAKEFVNQQYDLKSVIRWIAMSESFQRSSRNVANTLADVPAAGTAPLFSYYYTRPLQAEEVIRSLQIAAKLRTETGTQGNIAQARVDWLAQYQRTFAKEATDPDASLNLVHSGIMKQATSPGQESLLQGVLQAKLKFSEKVEHLFLAALSRKPTKQELAAAQKLTGISGMNETAALEDIWWALLNSSEFLLDH